MKIYFHSSRGSHESDSQAISLLREGGASVFSNLVEASGPALPDSQAARLEETGQSLLDAMDGLVVEGSEPSHEAGYLIAYAIAGRKPVLYLMERGKEMDEAIKRLQAGQNTARFFNAEYYSAATVAKLVSSFVKKVEVISGVEQPMIKFTLRITASIDRYLQWKVHNTTMTKADFVRRVLTDEVIKKDAEFQRMLKKEQIL